MKFNILHANDSIRLCDETQKSFSIESLPVNLHVMNLALGLHVIFAILAEFALVLAFPEEGTGQKAHFSLKDTPGSFTVHANKMLAKVSSKPDSIKVIVKPGMAEFPVPQLPTQKPLVHVASPAIVGPVGGWNYMSFGRRKRSRIQNGKESSLGKIWNVGVRKYSGKDDVKIIHSTFRKANSIIKAKHSSLPKHKSFKSNSIVKKKELGLGKRDNLSSIGKGNLKHFGNNILKRLNRKKSVKFLPKPRSELISTDSNIDTAKGLERTHRGHRRLDYQGKRSGHARPGQKRETVERNMQVQGETGKFSVHIDKKVSNVSSSTGGVKVFIKNPSPKQLAQLPREMLQLPGAMVQLPTGMTALMPQVPGSVSKFTRGISQLPKETPWVFVGLPHDWTGASN